MSNMAQEHVDKTITLTNEKTDLLNNIESMQVEMARLKLENSELFMKLEREKTQSQVLEPKLMTANLELEKIKACQGDFTQL